MLTGNPIHRSPTPTIVKIFMIWNVAPTALNASGRGQSETLTAGGQEKQLVAARPRRPSFGVQVVQISPMDSAGSSAQIAAKLASLTILTQRKLVGARPGEIPDL